MSRSIVIVDDHVLLAEALGSIIEKFRSFRVLYQVEHGKALIQRFSQSHHIPDVVLLDINMPVMDGFQTASWLKANHPDVRVLALSMQDQEDTLIKIIRCGAHGYLLKNIHPVELEHALNTLIEKGYYYPDWVTHKMVMSITGEQQTTVLPVLSEREQVFLQYAATELTYKEIGDKMNCSPRTVESYRDSLFEKLGLRTRIGLVIYALKHKIITITL